MEDQLALVEVVNLHSTPLVVSTAVSVGELYIGYQFGTSDILDMEQVDYYGSIHPMFMESVSLDCGSPH